MRTDRWRHWRTDVKKVYPPSPTCTVCGGYNEKKNIFFVSKKSFSKTQINMKMQKPTFLILTPQRLKMLLLLKERKKERKKEKKKDLAKITHVSLKTSNCGEIDIAYHVYVLKQGQAHFNWILSSTSNIIGVYYLARAKYNEIK